jgi:hypothetical protein
MYIFRRPIYKNLLNNNNKRFFSSNIDNKLDNIDKKLVALNYNIRVVYICSLINIVVSLFF